MIITGGATIRYAINERNCTKIDCIQDFPNSASFIIYLVTYSRHNYVTNHLFKPFQIANMIQFSIPHLSPHYTYSIFSKLKSALSCSDISSILMFKTPKEPKANGAPQMLNFSIIS